MAKMIKFDLPIDGVKVATLDDLRDHFTTEILRHYRSGLLARWLRSRSLDRELSTVEALAADDDAVALKELCRIFEVEADDGAIAAAIAEATGVPRVRADQMRSERARLSPGDTFRDCPEGPEMVVVPAGSFMMGSPDWEEGRRDNEGPLLEVRIDYRLAVGVYPVTFDEWDACVSEGGCGGNRPYDAGWGRETRPVINVSWVDAQQYLNWLSWKTGKGYRLLTESEWEYVARAGTTTRYWWGDEIGENRANCDGCESRWDKKKTAPVGEFNVWEWVRDNNKTTAPVGSFAANAFGLYDVHGNVWEWVEDCWNASYRGAPSDGSAWTSGDCRQRVLRGGSCSSVPWDLRSAVRFRNFTGNRLVNAGFRLARTLTP